MLAVNSGFILGTEWSPGSIFLPVSKGKEPVERLSQSREQSKQIGLQGERSYSVLEKV